MSLMPAATPAETALGLSLPHRRMEEWRWTDLRRLVAKPYRPGTPSGAEKEVDRLVRSSPLAGLKHQRIVLVNGVLDVKRSDLRGIDIVHAAPHAAIDDPLIGMNASFAPKGISLAFKGTSDNPVEVLHVATAAGEHALATRLHLHVADHASATVIETFVGAGDYLVNPLTTMSLGLGARLDRVKIEHDAPEAVHLSHVVIDMAADAILNDFTFTAGSRVSRQNATVSFNGENANARIAGSYLLRNAQHVDTRIVVNHKVPHCTSRELFKCVMQDKSRGIFQGKVIVQPDAQKTDGKQSSHALLLSEEAEFDAKPELEIYADDVVCGHGSTAGDLNPDHMFYLKSRGIPEVEARTLLVQAFVGEAIDTVENEALRETLAAFAEKIMLGTAA